MWLSSPILCLSLLGVLMRFMPTIRTGRPGGRQLLKRFDEFFNKFERSYFDQQRALAERENEALSIFVPEVDIEESELMFLITIEISDFKSKEVRIDLKGRNLLVRADGKLQRSFTIPDNIDENRIMAHFDEGVLKILLPKMKVTEPQKITIN